MRPVKAAGPWVVYRMSVNGKLQDAKSICRQSAWEELEASHPGMHQLIQADIATESEAEKLARGTAGDPVPRRTGPKPPREVAAIPTTPEPAP